MGMAGRTGRLGPPWPAGEGHKAPYAELWGRLVTSRNIFQVVLLERPGDPESAQSSSSTATGVESRPGLFSVHLDLL